MCGPARRVATNAPGTFFTNESGTIYCLLLDVANLTTHLCTLDVATQTSTNVGATSATVGGLEFVPTDEADMP